MEDGREVLDGSEKRPWCIRHDELPESLDGPQIEIHMLLPTPCVGLSPARCLAISSPTEEQGYWPSPSPLRMGSLQAITSRGPPHQGLADNSLFPYPASAAAAAVVVNPGSSAPPAAAFYPRRRPMFPPPAMVIQHREVPYPVGFDPGRGRVFDLNEELRQEYSSFDWFERMFVQGRDEINKQAAVKRMRMLHGDRILYHPKPRMELCYAIRQSDDAARKLFVRRGIAVSTARRIIELGGKVFTIPASLGARIDAVIGVLPPSDRAVLGPVDEVARQPEKDAPAPLQERIARQPEIPPVPEKIAPLLHKAALVSSPEQKGAPTPALEESLVQEKIAPLSHKAALVTLPEQKGAPTPALEESLVPVQVVLPVPILPEVSHTLLLEDVAAVPAPLLEKVVPALPLEKVEVVPDPLLEKVVAPLLQEKTPKRPCPWR